MGAAEGLAPGQASRLAKLFALEPEDAGRLAEAAVALVVARVAIRFFRLESLTLLSRRVALASATGSAAENGNEPGELPDSAQQLGWAADAASNAIGVTCVPRSLGLAWLLARRGLAAEVCLGAPRNGRRFPWHAWVELNGHPLGSASAKPGDPQEPAFELICRLPREAPTCTGMRESG